MTASRPTQVTQSEGEAERVGEKGGRAGQRKNRGAGGGGRKEDRKRQRVAEEGEREKQKSITERMNGREVNSGGNQQSGLESTD